MDPAQFKEYTNGMAVLRTIRTLRRHYEQYKQVLIRQTTPCDGTSSAGVRAWFKDIELAGAEVGAENHIEIAARTAAGSLRWELERYIAGVLATNDQINIRFNVPWADVKAHLWTSFLNVDESSALSDEVEKTRQSAYEPEASFSRQFWEVADAAYPGDGRNDDQNRILIRAFVRGLRSDELARKLVEEDNPTTLEEAFTTLAGYTARKDAYARLSRHEQLMVVAPVNPAPSLPVVARDDQTTTTLLKKLLQSQERLQTKVAKLEAQARPPQTTGAPATRPAFQERGPEQPLCTVQEPGAGWTPDGKPRCFGCGHVGHMPASAAKAMRETDRSRRGGVRSTSGRFTGWWPVHWGIGEHGSLLYAPTTRHISHTGESCSSPQATG